MQWRRVGVWFVLLLSVLGCAAGAAGYWVWQQRQTLLEQAVRDAIANQLPGWEIEFGAVAFDFRRSLTLRDVRLYAGRQQTPLASIPELVFEIDADRFRSAQAIDIERVRIIEPTLFLARNGDGVWNYQQLPPLPASEGATPECVVRQATVHVSYQHHPSVDPLELTLFQPTLDLVPSGYRTYAFEGLTRIDEAGLLQISGSYDLEGQAWTLNGRLNELATSGPLLDLAAKVSPDVRQTLEELDQPAPASGLESVTPDIPAGETSPLGIGGRIGLRFKLAKWSPDTDLDYRVVVDVKQGQIANDFLPFPLREVTGQIYCDTRQVLFRKFSATNGITQIHLDGRWARSGHAVPGTLTVRAEDVLLDDRLRARLPSQYLATYDSLKPTGRISIRSDVVFDGTGGWTTKNTSLTARNCGFTYQSLPYPLSRVNGTLTQKGDRIEGNFVGIAARRPVRLTGWVRNPGSDAEIQLAVRATDVPFDDTLRRSLPDGLREGIDSLHATGILSGQVRMYRPSRTAWNVANGPAPASMPWTIGLEFAVRNGSMRADVFPYPIGRLSGKVRWSNTDSICHLEDFTGTHRDADLTASGTFTKVPGTASRLHLDVEANNARLNDALRSAVPESVQKVWSEVNATGLLDLTAVVDWTQDRPVGIRLPKLTLRKGSLMLRRFAFPLDDVTLTGTVTQDEFRCTSLVASHDQTRIRAKGFYRKENGTQWRLRIDDLNAEQLVPDRVFRRALPESVRAAIEQLDPTGKPLSVSGAMEMRGTLDGQTRSTAAWDLKIRLAGGAIAAGLPFESVFGTITSRGSWDGGHLVTGGQLDLDSVYILKHQLTQVRGPYLLNDRQLIVGSKDILFQNPNQPVRIVPVNERISAKAIGGTITLDASAALSNDPAYRIKMTMNNGRLEQYALRYIPGTKNLAGVMNGWIDLQGRGSRRDTMTGRGQLQISPAALYELPIVFQIFRQFTSISPDRSAFDYAFVDFDIVREQFQFRLIDLVGSSLSLRGQGWTRFDGRLALDFYSMMGRNQVPIPILGEVFNELGKGWVGVRVRGRINQPTAQIRAVPELDDALGRFLSTFDPTTRNMPRLQTAPRR